MLGQYKQFLKIKKVNFGLAAEVDFIDTMVNPYLPDRQAFSTLQKMDLGNNILTVMSNELNIEIFDNEQN